MPVRQGLVVVALAAAVIVCSCTTTPTRVATSPTPKPSVAPIGPLVAPPAVMALARMFADQFAAGQYEAQWGELSPETQATWPSELARVEMLAAKFGSEVKAVSLGSPALDPVWTEPEDPAGRVTDVWTVPVDVTFRSPQSLRPAGVAGVFSVTPPALTTGAGPLAVICGGGAA